MDQGWMFLVILYSQNIVFIIIQNSVNPPSPPIASFTPRSSLGKKKMSPHPQVVTNFFSNSPN